MMLLLCCFPSRGRGSAVHSSRAANRAVCQIPDPRSPRTVPDVDQQAVGSESHNPPLPLPGAIKRHSRNPRRPRTCHGPCDCGTAAPTAYHSRRCTWPNLDLVWMPQRMSVLITAPSGDEQPSDLQFPHLSSRTQLLGFQCKGTDLLTAYYRNWEFVSTTTRTRAPRAGHFKAFQSSNNGSRTISSGSPQGLGGH